MGWYYPLNDGLPNEFPCCRTRRYFCRRTNDEVGRVNTVERHKQEKHPLDVVDDVYDYADEGLSFEEIEDRAGGGEWERLKWAGMYAQKQEATS